MQLIEEVTAAEPISWSPGSPYERNLMTAINDWSRENPEQSKEDLEISIHRTILQRIGRNLQNPALAAYDTEVSHDTVWRTLLRQTSLDEGTEEYRSTLAVFDAVWCDLVVFFSIFFTKPPRTNSE